MAAERLAARISGKAEVYRVEFQASMGEALQKGRDKKKKSWTFRYTVDMQEEEVKIGYTLDWSKGWKQKVSLEQPAQSKISVASFTTLLVYKSTSNAFGGVQILQLEHYKWSPDCKLLSKAAIEKGTGRKHPKSDQVPRDGGPSLSDVGEVQEER
jgi:hypothetical protein